MNDIPLSFFIVIAKWILAPLILFSFVSATIYFFSEPTHQRNWSIEHSRLAEVLFDSSLKESQITLKNVRDFDWFSDNKKQYKEMNFPLKSITGLKAVVSHFSPISEVAHVFIIFTLDNKQEFGVSIEARREQGEAFSLHGGLLAKFEIIYLLATPEDLLGVRKKNNEEVHIYPIKASQEKAQELFLLIANEINLLAKKPALYHLFFKNCTNQLVKNVSILTEEKYPWYFQTLAPGNTGRILYELELIDLPDTGFEDIQAKTLLN